ncbi:MAG: hypothetical protein ACOC0D_05510 [Spirochaeta sp.]
MKKKLFLGLLLCIPVLMFANAFHAFRFVQQENAIRSMDREQRSLIEANKRAIAEISMLMSPAHIRSVAEADPRYEYNAPTPVLYIKTREARSE